MIAFAVATGATVAAAVAVALAHAVTGASSGQLPAGPQPSVTLRVLPFEYQHQLKNEFEQKQI